MNSDRKKKIKSILLEIGSELLFGMTALGVGAGVLSLFGKGDNLWQMDPDLVMLLGFLVAAVSVALLLLPIYLIRAKRKARFTEKTSLEDVQNE